MDVFGFGNAVACEDESVAGMEGDLAGVEVGVRKEAYRDVGLAQLLYRGLVSGLSVGLCGADEERAEVAAVDVFEVAGGGEADDDQGGVFAGVLGAEVGVDASGDGGEWEARGKLGVEHALQRGGEDGGRGAFAGDVGDDEGKTGVIVHDVEEVAADLAAGQVAGVDDGVVEFGEVNLHEPLLDAGGKGELFAVATRVGLEAGELCVFNEGGRLAGEGAKEVVIGFREDAGGEAMSR